MERKGVLSRVRDYTRAKVSFARDLFFEARDLAEFRRAVLFDLFSDAVLGMNQVLANRWTWLFPKGSAEGEFINLVGVEKYMEMRRVMETTVDDYPKNLDVMPSDLGLFGSAEPTGEEKIIGGSPMFAHHCDDCIFLGHEDGCDLYACNMHFKQWPGPAWFLTIRYGDHESPNDSGHVTMHETDVRHTDPTKVTDATRDETRLFRRALHLAEKNIEVTKSRAS